jgi:hypothetical protein
LDSGGGFLGEKQAEHFQAHKALFGFVIVVFFLFCLTSSSSSCG